MIAEDTVTATTSRVRRMAREHTDSVVLVTLLALYLVARVLSLRGLEVFTSFDTGSYAERPGVTEAFDTLSFTGDAPRTWGAPLVYAAVGTDPARALLQWAIGTVAWSLLVVGLWGMMRTLVARTVSAAALIALALTADVASWDFAILSESLSIGLGVMALGLLAVWARTGSRAAAVGLGAVGVWWTFTRPDVLPYVVALIVTLAVYALARRHRRSTAVLVAVALVLGVGWYGATASRNDEAFRKWGLHLSLSESTFVYRLRLQVYPDPQVLDAYTRELDMPTCPAAAAAARQEDWVIEQFVQAYRSCPSLVSWAAREKTTAALRYAFADPGHFVRLTLDAMPGLLGGAVYAEPADLPPRPQDRLYFPPLGWVLRALLAVFLVALAALLATRAFRHRPWLAVGGTALVVISGVSAVAGTLYSAGEYGRFGIQEAVLLRVGVILMLAAALDTLLARRTPTVDENDRGAPTAIGAGPPTSGE